MSKHWTYEDQLQLCSKSRLVRTYALLHAKLHNRRERKRAERSTQLHWMRVNGLAEWYEL